jgi:hypothetical protein
MGRFEMGRFEMGRLEMRSFAVLTMNRVLRDRKQAGKEEQSGP